MVAELGSFPLERLGLEGGKRHALQNQKSHHHDSLPPSASASRSLSFLSYCVSLLFLSDDRPPGRARARVWVRCACDGKARDVDLPKRGRARMGCRVSLPSGSERSRDGREKEAREEHHRHEEKEKRLDARTHIYTLVHDCQVGYLLLSNTNQALTASRPCVRSLRSVRSRLG